MCLLIFKDVGKAFAEASKKKSMNRTATTLVAGAVMLGLAIIILSAKGGNLAGGLYFALNVFVLVLGFGIIGGYIIKIIANTLGAKGSFYEGLTVISYALTPITAGVLIAAVLAWLPLFGVVFGAIALTILFAMGLAVFYRGVKEMFRTDILTSFITISVFTLALIIALYASLGLNVITNIGRFIPVA